MLSWTLKWGAEVRVLQEFEESTGITPQGLLERKRLEAGGVRYWEAFWAVGSGRGSGLESPHPIPVSEVKAYLEMIEESSIVERLKYLRLIRSLDNVFLEHTRNKIKAAKK